MLTFEQFLENAGLVAGELGEADLTTLRKSYEELSGAAETADGEDTRTLVQKALDGISVLAKSPKMLADLLHHMQANQDQGGPEGADGEADDGGEDTGEGEGEGEGEDQVDEEELASTMREMGLGAGKEGAGGDGDGDDPDDVEKVGKVRKALMDELGATDIFGADEVVGTLLKAHGVALEAHSAAVIATVTAKIDGLASRLDTMMGTLQKAVTERGAVPTPGRPMAARERQFGSPALNAPLVDETTANHVKGQIIQAFAKGLIDEATTDAMKASVGDEEWTAKWGAKYADLEKKLSGIG